MGKTVPVAGAIPLVAPYSVLIGPWRIEISLDASHAKTLARTIDGDREPSWACADDEDVKQ